MLDPDDVDLDELAEALEDHSADESYGHSWWLDPTTGEVRYHSADLDEETADDLDEAGLIYVAHHSPANSPNAASPCHSASAVS